MGTRKSETTELVNQLKKLNDKKQNFINGVFRGFGAAVGATLVAAIAFWFLTKIFDSVNDVPVLEDFIDQLNQAINSL